MRHWSRYDPARSAERTWILTIARNLLRDHFRRRRHRDAVSLDEHPALVDAVAGTDEVGRRLDRDEVRSWPAALSERERDLLALRSPGTAVAQELGEVVLGVHARNLRSAPADLAARAAAGREDRSG